MCRCEFDNAGESGPFEAKPRSCSRSGVAAAAAAGAGAGACLDVDSAAASRLDRTTMAPFAFGFDDDNDDNVAEVPFGGALAGARVGSAAASDASPSFPSLSKRPVTAAPPPIRKEQRHVRFSLDDVEVIEFEVGPFARLLPCGSTGRRRGDEDIDDECVDEESDENEEGSLDEIEAFVTSAVVVVLLLLFWAAWSLGGLAMAVEFLQALSVAAAEASTRSSALAVAAVSNCGGAAPLFCAWCLSCLVSVFMAALILLPPLRRPRDGCCLSSPTEEEGGSAPSWFYARLLLLSTSPLFAAL